MHLFRIFTEKILHQPPKRRVVTPRSIDVEDMRSISKRPPDFLHDSLHMVQRESLSIHIVFRDEDHPCFRKPRELRPFRQFPRIHHAAVVSRSARSCAFIGTLNLAVVKSPLAVFRQHIETHAAPIEVVRALLRDNMPDDEIVPAEEEPQQKLHPFDIVVETYIEKRIVDQTESLNQRTIFLWNVLLHHPHRVCAPLSSDPTIIVCTAASIVKTEKSGRSIDVKALLP